MNVIMRKSTTGLEQLHKVVRISEMIESVNNMLNYRLEVCEKKEDGFYYGTESDAKYLKRWFAIRNRVMKYYNSELAKIKPFKTN